MSWEKNISYYARGNGIIGSEHIYGRTILHLLVLTVIFLQTLTAEEKILYSVNYSPREQALGFDIVLTPGKCNGAFLGARGIVGKIQSDKTEHSTYLMWGYTRIQNDYLTTYVAPGIRFLFKEGVSGMWVQNGYHPDISFGAIVYAKKGPLRFASGHFDFPLISRDLTIGVGINLLPVAQTISRKLFKS